MIYNQRQIIKHINLKYEITNFYDIIKTYNIYKSLFNQINLNIQNYDNEIVYLFYINEIIINIKNHKIYDNKHMLHWLTIQYVKFINNHEHYNNNKIKNIFVKFLKKYKNTNAIRNIVNNKFLIISKKIPRKKHFVSKYITYDCVVFKSYIECIQQIINDKTLKEPSNYSILKWLYEQRYMFKRYMYHFMNYNVYKIFDEFHEKNYPNIDCTNKKNTKYMIYDENKFKAKLLRIQ